MTTRKQIEANRRNARISRGPKTPEGRAVSSRNAIKHGRDNKGRRRKGTSGNSVGKAKGKTPTQFPQRTPEEQALVDQWVGRSRLERPPKLKADSNPKSVVLDTDDEELWSARLAKALGVHDPSLMDLLMNQVAHCFWKTDGPKAANRSIAAIQGIGPHDGLEALLASQMAGTHIVAMEMLRRAMVLDQTFEGRNAAVNQATKLLRTFATQMEALSRHRGKGQQKMMVEHVHVHRGGQAIVGQVSRDKAKAEGAPSKTEE